MLRSKMGRMGLREMWVGLLILLALAGCRQEAPIPNDPVLQQPTPPYLIGVPTPVGVQLSWSWLTLGDNTLNPQAFEILYSATSVSDLERLLLVNAETTRFDFDSLLTSNPRYFQIRVLHADGEWYSSNAISLTPGSLKEVQNVFPSQQNVYEGSWDAAGKKVVYTFEAEEGKSLYAFDVSDKENVRIKGGGDAAIEENSGRLLYITDLVFNRNHPDSSTYLGMLEPDGRSQIVTGGNAHLSSPQWAGHGRQYAYLSTEGGEGAFRIWVATLGASTNSYPLTSYFPDLYDLSNPVDRSPLHPVWGPKDQIVAYDRLTYKPFRDSIFLSRDIQGIDPSSGEEKNIISSIWNDMAASYSPDGEYLAFISDRSGLPAIWLKDLQTGGPDQMIWWGEKPRISLQHQKLSWHPTERKLLFTGWQNDSTLSLFTLTGF